MGQSGRLGGGLVVVGDDDVDAARLRGGDLRNRSDAAVGGDQQAGATSRELVDRRQGEPVAILHPAGDEPIAVGAELSERPDQDRRGRDAVDVIVAVDRDALAGGDRGADRADRLANPLELGRVMPLVGREEGACVLDRSVAPANQCDGHGLGKIELAGKLGRLGVRVRLKPETLLAFCPTGGAHQLRLGPGGDGITPSEDGGSRPGGPAGPRTGRRRARGERRSGTARRRRSELQAPRRGRWRCPSLSRVRR